MGQWIDFKQLRSKLSFPAVLDHYAVALKAKADQAQGLCPLPSHKGERRSPSFSANLARGIWQCFGCGAKGNVLDFAIRMEGLSPDLPADVRTVALRLQERFQIEGVTREGRTNTRREPPDRAATARIGEPEDQLTLGATADQMAAPTTSSIRINEPLDFELKGLKADHPYLVGRGFLPETIRHFGLGFCARGLMADRVVIPLHDTNGRLVGYAGRIVDDSTISESSPKYKFPVRRERKGVVHEFHQSHLLYNAHRIKGRVDRLIVVAGFPSVWWLHQAEIENAVAIMGPTCSREQAAIILAKTTASSRIAVFAGSDEAGQRCGQSVFAAVGSHLWIRHVYVPGRQSLTDCQPDELARYLRA